ncbi:sigma factor-like helix-turn-helix DNA-binding protein [Nocardiopsis quinghaiensis]|uniref:sigma factor-like helix-turn-helix DNA-binding protein n=1 Tax=Nocardiopsis quinghaiensis TaxID=464995 RepID=UPI00123BD241|nr:sigma factor-like helix-turn-helix DNA-binding protein [Nocardiopsis quinghaiensis]
MSIDAAWAAHAVVDIERSVELSYTKHARDVLFRHWQEEAEGEDRDSAPDTGPYLFGGKAEHRALATATRRLPPEERRVVRMRLSMHESTDTIAAALNLSPSHVARLLTQGLSRIRDELLT